MYQPPGTQLELFNKKTLPIIPPTGILQTIPLAPPPRPRRTEIDEIGDEIDCDDDDGPPNTLADDTQRMLELYNRYLGLLKGTEDEAQKGLSGEFVELGSEMTRISERAGEEIQRKMEAMYGVIGKMFGRFELDEVALESGNWACESHCCHDYQP